MFRTLSLLNSISACRRFTLRTLGLAVSALGLNSYNLHAEELFQLRDVETVFESQPTSEVPVQQTALFDGTSSFMSSMFQVIDESASRNQAGLLGRAYIDGQYISLVTPEEFEVFGDTMPGFRTSLNFPAPWQNRLPSFLYQDVFLSARHIGISGTIDVLGNPFSMDTEIDNWVIGTTIYGSFDSTVRPFVQIGYDHQTVEIEMTGLGQTFFERDHEEKFFCSPGIEIDLMSNIAFRMATEIDFEEFKSSIMTSELIFWMTRNLFVRGGLINDVEWETYGGLIGGGLAY